MQVSMKDHKGKGRDFDVTLVCGNVTIIMRLSNKDSAVKWLDILNPADKSGTL